MIDLHTHSTASDGMLSPAELVKAAVERNIKVLALTDHDTIDGINEASEEAGKHPITFVPGVELNIQWPTGEFHLLGLGIKKAAPEFLSVLNRLKAGRLERNLSIIQKMREAGIDASLEEIQSQFKTECLGRPHFAAYLVQKKVVKTRQQAFDKYLAKNAPWYTERVGADLDEAINAIKLCGARPVMAHPLSIYVSFGKIRPVLENLKERGIEGLEAFHPGARVGECLRLEELAHDIGFFVTAGSDYHGESVRADRKLGHTCGSKKIDDRIWEDIRNKFL
ncbi:MAG: PHP domain-containing protein [Treponema sp.]|uniref:PHP domain-containing protein n=1 Tax=Treponema sp. TaxID=166 RepID=UPI001B46E517|nr:PHP domain-containing protein [Treponema sp.]MBP5402252.1 PHP domain-containing protein [Treponema sp.]MBR5933250.1 PHP domain-containing protein [Treponema sp.]